MMSESKEEDEEKEEEEEENKLGEFFQEVEICERLLANNEEEGEEEEREKSFLDDDGVLYVWNDGIGRYEEAHDAHDDDNNNNNDDNNNNSARVEFDVSEMTYDDGDDNERPSIIFGNENVDFDDVDEKNKMVTKRKAPLIDIEEIRKKREQKKRKTENKKNKKNMNNSNQARTTTINNNTTSVFVENLPLDATVERVEKYFAKCGAVKQDAATLKAKIKLYEGEDGLFNGNALVTYLLRPSVELAINILDGSKFELVGTEVKVTEADFSKSKSNNAFLLGDDNNSNNIRKENNNRNNNNNNNNNAIPKDEIRKNAALLKRKAERQLGWDGFDDEHDATKTMVVLRNIYNDEDLDEARKEGLNAQEFSEELKEDVADECQAKCGIVENAYVNANGIITVRFKEPTSAEKCLELMHERFFGGKQIKAEMWNGIEKFLPLKTVERKETEEEEKRRLDAYASTLGNDDDSDEEDF